MEPAAVPDLSNIFTFLYSENDSGGNRVDGGNVFARLNTANILDKRELKQVVATWELNYGINDQWSFSNVISFNNAKFDSVFDDDATAAGGEASRSQVNDIDTITEEMRVFYDNEKIHATAGLYYANEKENNKQLILTSLNVGQLIGQPVLNTIYANPFLIRGDFTNKDTTANYAAFFSVDYDLSDLVTVNVGLRYDQASKKFNGDTVASLGSPLPNPALYGPFAGIIAQVNAGLLQFTGSNPERVNEKYDAWLPSASIVFHWRDDFTTILQAKKAYRAGGGGTSLLLGNYSYAPETSWTYEAGFRKKLLDDRILVSSNFFYMKWSNMQVAVHVPFGSGDFTIENAASADLKGFEFEVSAKPNEEWDVFINVGYSDTEFKNFTPQRNTSTADFSGNAFGDAPKWTMSAGFGWHSSVNGLFAQADINYTDGSPTNNANTSFIGSHTLVNARFGYNLDHFSISAYIRNAFNVEYISENLDEIMVSDVVRVGRPRVFGAELKFSY